ncbi:MAG: zinc ABC transporter substrate-binding protein [Gammaproteobacteria bacterium]
MKKIVGVLLFFLAMAARAEAPTVVVSIMPLYHIAQAVMGKLGSPVLLVPQGASEHAYALKPSQYEAIKNADVVMWIGPGLETYLVDALEVVPPKKQLILINEPAMIRYELRGAGGHDTDPHLWLDPLNAMTAAKQLSKRLSDIDPEHEKLYKRQTDAFITEIAALNTQLAQKLGPVQSVPYIDYHDAFQYFEKRYGLRRLESISHNPHVPLSATRWIEVGLLLKSEHIRCIFSEPENQTDLLRQLAADHGAKIGTLNPLGAQEPAGTAGYSALLTNIADSLVGCLEPNVGAKNPVENPFPL